MVLYLFENHSYLICYIGIRFELPIRTLLINSQKDEDPL